MKLKFFIGFFLMLNCRFSVGDELQSAHFSLAKKGLKISGKVPICTGCSVTFESFDLSNDAYTLELQVSQKGKDVYDVRYRLVREGRKPKTISMTGFIRKGAKFESSGKPQDDDSFLLNINE